MRALSKKQWLTIMGFVVLSAGASFSWHLTRPDDPKVSNAAKPTTHTNSSDNSNTVAIDFKQPEMPPDTFTQWKSDIRYQNPKTNIPYDDLFRNIEFYKSEFVRYTGEVVQVLGDAGNWTLRVNITKKGTPSFFYWQDTVLVTSHAQDRVIEKDLIELTGQVNGATTYQAVFGQDITVPWITIYENKVVGRAE